MNSIIKDFRMNDKHIVFKFSNDKRSVIIKFNERIFKSNNIYQLLDSLDISESLLDGILLQLQTDIIYQNEDLCMIKISHDIVIGFKSDYLITLFEKDIDSVKKVFHSLKCFFNKENNVSDMKQLRIHENHTFLTDFLTIPEIYLNIISNDCYLKIKQSDYTERNFISPVIGYISCKNDELYSFDIENNLLNSIFYTFKEISHMNRVNTMFDESSCLFPSFMFSAGMPFLKKMFKIDEDYSLTMFVKISVSSIFNNFLNMPFISTALENIIFNPVSISTHSHNLKNYINQISGFYELSLENENKNESLSLFNKALHNQQFYIDNVFSLLKNLKYYLSQKSSLELEKTLKTCLSFMGFKNRIISDNQNEIVGIVENQVVLYNFFISVFYIINNFFCDIENPPDLKIINNSNNLSIVFELSILPDNFDFYSYIFDISHLENQQLLQYKLVLIYLLYYSAYEIKIDSSLSTISLLFPGYEMIRKQNFKHDKIKSDVKNHSYDCLVWSENSILSQIVLAFLNKLQLSSVLVFTKEEFINNISDNNFKLYICEDSTVCKFSDDDLVFGNLKKKPLVLLTENGINVDDLQIIKIIKKPVNKLEFINVISEAISIINEKTQSSPDVDLLLEEIKKIPKSFLDNFEKIYNDLIMDEILNYFKQLKLISTENNLSLLDNYLDDIVKYAESFDISLLSDSLSDFNKIIKRIGLENGSD